MVWGFITTYPYFYVLNKINKFRISPIIEIIGMDEIMMERVVDASV
jgi:hypothetical protein